MSGKVFLITGTSTGFGAEYVKEAIKNGDIVVATARDPSKISFPNTNEKNYLALALDVTDKSSIEKAFSSTLEKFGRIDVVVNNAGYGLSGPFETLTEAQIRLQMEINFFGLIDVTRKALEIMRTQKPQGGVIQQITSIGGLRGFPTFSLYCASKWAVEGFTEAVAAEMKPEWNIKLTCIEPGGFRTDWAGRSMAFGEIEIADYDHLDARKRMGARHGNQAGDPVKAAVAMHKLAVMKDPPLRIVLGSDAFKNISGKVQEYKEEIEKYEELSNSTDVDGYVAPS